MTSTQSNGNNHPLSLTQSQLFASYRRQQMVSSHSFVTHRFQSFFCKDSRFKKRGREGLCVIFLSSSSHTPTYPYHQTYLRVHTHIHKRIHAHARMHAHTHACRHIRKRAHTHTHTHTHSRKCPLSHTYTLTNMQTWGSKHMHAFEDTVLQTPTHTQWHTHT